MSSWCRYESEVTHHPKTWKLRTLLNEPLADAYLARIWAWTAACCPTGILPADQASLTLESAAMWSGRAGRLFEALVTAGFVDLVQGLAMIHGWTELNGYQIREAKRLHYRKMAQSLEGRVHLHAVRTNERTNVEDLDHDRSADSGGIRAGKPASPESVKQMQDAYNQHRGALPEWTRSGPKRAKDAQRTHRDHGLEAWTQCVERAARSAFLTGTNDRGWVASPEFLMRPGKLEEVLEGKYDDRRKNGVAGNVGSKSDFDNDPLFSPTQPKGSA